MLAGRCTPRQPRHHAHRHGACRAAARPRSATSSAPRATTASASSRRSMTSTGRTPARGAPAREAIRCSTAAGSQGRTTPLMRDGRELAACGETMRVLVRQERARRAGRPRGRGGVARHRWACRRRRARGLRSASRRRARRIATAAAVAQRRTRRWPISRRRTPRSTPWCCRLCRRATCEWPRTPGGRRATGGGATSADDVATSSIATIGGRTCGALPRVACAEDRTKRVWIEDRPPSPRRRRATTCCTTSGKRLAVR